MTSVIHEINMSSQQITDALREYWAKHNPEAFMAWWDIYEDDLGRGRLEVHLRIERASKHA